MSSTSAEILEAKIERMGRELRASDLVSGVLRTLLGVLSILFLAVLAEQCLTQHGLGPMTRWLVSLLVYGVGGALLVVQVLRVIRHRINPVYAAALIEDAEPGLKNSLISWVYLRRQHGRDPVSSRVFQSLESHTAETLTTTENSVVVDRHHLIQLGVALGVLLTLLCVYIVVSPKNPIVTFARILLPWADIDAPTRVQISEVRPGDATCTMGETLVISATVHGLREDEGPQVRLDTMDGRIQGQLVPMRRDEKAAFGYTATVPPGSEGMQQDLIYTVIAGDAQSSRFDVKMQIPMLAEVTAVTYDYPAFTGQSTKRMVGSGNIHAPESTKLEIEVHANRPLAKATLIPDGLSVTPIPLTISKENTQNAKGTWILEADPEHPERPRYAAYRLQVQDTSGNHNANPPSYRITMIPNRLPKIEWTNPPEEGVNVPMNQELTLSLTANDPDYGLKEVTITFEKDDKVFAEDVLWQDAQDETDASVVHEKTVASSFSFRGDRAAWKLRPGDRIAYRASCRDLRGVPLAQPAQTETRSFILEQPNRNATKKPEEKKTVKNPTNSTVTTEDQPTSDTDTTGDANDIDNTNNTKTTDNTSAADTSDTASETASDMSTDRPSETPSDSTSQDSANASETTESAESTSDASQNSQKGSSSKDSNSTDAAERSSTEPSPSERNTQKNRDAQKNVSEQKNNSSENSSSKGDGNSGKNDNAAQNSKSKQQNEAGNDTANGEDQTAGSSASASSDSSRQNGWNGENGENGENKNGDRSEASNALDSRKQERVDSQTSPGDAMERILEYAKQQSEKQSRQSSEQPDPQPEKQSSDSAHPSDTASSSDSQSFENSRKNDKNSKNNGNNGNKKNNKNDRAENASPNEPSVENSSEKSERAPEKASPNASDSQKDSSDSQNSNSQDQTSSDQMPSGEYSDGNASDKASKEESGQPTSDEMSSNTSQPGTSSSNSSQPGSPSDSSQGNTPQSGTPSSNDSANSSGQNPSSENPSQNVNSPQNNASSSHPSDGTQTSNAADTESSSFSERSASNATTDNQSSESSPEKTDSDAISGSDQAGDPRTARAAAKGTDPKDASRSDDPELRRAAQEAVQQGAETLRSTDPVLRPRDETLSTNRPYGSDQTDPTTSDTPVRPGDPLAQQALHPETPNRQAIQHSPDAMSGDGRESGGTRPTERPQPVNAAGNDFRNATPDGTGRISDQADEDGTQSVTTNQLSATTSESPNGRPGQKMQVSDSQTNTQKQPFSNASATQDAQNAQNDPNPLGKMGQSNNVQGMSGHESSGPGRKSNPSAEESVNAPHGDSRESGAGYQNPESMNPAEDGSRETGADQARTDFTRQNTQLALQTLEEALKKQDTVLLDQLGWSRAEAEAFLRQWKQIAAVAGESTQEGEDAKKSLKSLGLSAQNAMTRRAVPGQKARQLRQTSTIEAPAEWNEWFQAYRRSVGQTSSKPTPTPDH